MTGPAAGLRPNVRRLVHPCPTYARRRSMFELDFLPVEHGEKSGKLSRDRPLHPSGMHADPLPDDRGGRIGVEQPGQPPALLAIPQASGLARGAA